MHAAVCTHTHARTCGVLLLQQALQTAGLPADSVLEQALVVFAEGAPPKDRQKRCELLFAFEERDPELLEQLSRVYYKRVDAMDSVPEEDLTALQLAFMRTHAAELVET